MGTISNLKPWPKGVSGNPAGRPKGSRGKLTEAFLAALAQDFNENGIEAIAAAREKDPMGYVKTVASLCPRELDIKTPLQELTDDEVVAAIDDLRNLIDRAESSRATSGGSETAEQPADAVLVSPVSETG